MAPRLPGAIAPRVRGMRRACQFFRVKGIPSAVTVPAAQVRLGVDRVAANVDLEVEVAADSASVARLPHRADALAGPDTLAAVDESGPRHVGIEVAAVLAFAVDQQVVAVQGRVVAPAKDPSAAHRDQRRPTGSRDVEPFVPPSSIPRRPEFSNGPPRPMRPVHGEDVRVVLDAAVRTREGRGGEDEEGEKG